MPTVTAATTACNGQVMLAGLSDGLVVCLAAQAKPAPSTKSDIQPSYIATHHARPVTCIAATANAFATASDDCTIVISQIGCLFGGEGAAHNVAKGSKLRYRVTGTHALPITGLAFLPSDEGLLASCSLDGTVVIHRLRFTKAASASTATLPLLPLSQSLDRLIRLPFPVLAMRLVTPSDGTLLAAAGWDEKSNQAFVAIIDLSVAHRDGNGSGRPLQPFAVLAMESPIHASSGFVNKPSSLILRCDGTNLTLEASTPTFLPTAALCSGTSPAAFTYTSTSDKKGEHIKASWPIVTLLKALAVSRTADDAKAVVTKEESVSHATPAALFAGTQTQVTNALAAIVGPSAAPNAYYASLYANFCWSSSGCPKACVGSASAPKAVTAVASDSSDDEDGAATAQGLGKRARKTKSRLARSEAETADWARLAFAIDNASKVEPFEGASEVDRLPLRYTQLVASRTLLTYDTPLEYEPLAKTTLLKSAMSIEVEEEATLAHDVASQLAKNAEVQARIDALYSVVAAANTSRKSGRDTTSGSPSERPSKRLTSESQKKKKAISLT